MTESQQPSLQPPPLEYAQRPRAAWISRHRRKLIALALLIAIAGPIWWNWESLKRLVLWHYWFHQAAAHRMPGESVSLIVEDQTLARSIPTTNPDYVNPPGTVIIHGQVGTTIAYYSPMAYRQLFALDSRIGLFSDDNAGLGPVAFMGLRKRPDGAQRLVIINGGVAGTSDFTHSIGVLVMPMPGLFDSRPAAPLPPPVTYGMFGNTIVQLQSGLADVEDPTRINLPYILRDATRMNIGPMVQVGQGEIAAWVQNDDSLKLRYSNPLSGPTTLPGSIAAIQSTPKPARNGMFIVAPPARSPAVSPQGSSRGN